MSVTELLPNLQKLSRSDKLKIMQFLIAELAKEEDNGNLLSEFQSNKTYLIHSPYDCFEAAHQMNQMLAEYKQKKNVE
ncbi:MAG: hypothetical protein AB4058_02085 [Microcystaceae cyanobacterium]